MRKSKPPKPARFLPVWNSAYQSARKFYWKARNQYARYLFWHDVDLWRKLMPCDPIITVAEDVVFFECFSADESSYGCLTVDREDTFGPSSRPANRHDQRRLFLESLPSFSIAPLVPGNAVHGRSQRV